MKSSLNETFMIRLAFALYPLRLRGTNQLKVLYIGSLIKVRITKAFHYDTCLTDFVPYFNAFLKHLEHCEN